jgi:peptidoglycan-associated lipoprotein
MRFIALLALTLLVTACSSTDDSAGGSAASATGSGAMSSGSAGGMTAAIPGSQADLEQSTSSDRVFFGFDEYSLTADARQQVSRWATWLQANPGVNILVEGHADERGTRDYNFALGARRSHAVKEALMGMGISGSRIETTTFGKERPAVMGSTESAWAQNRRAVVVVTSGATS